ncbi:MAG: 30S ribosomal protein S19e [archaeon]|nr:30S ribosomal protein S19e [archaeon]
MVSVYDVKAADLIKEISTDLKDKVTQPKFVKFVKTGRHRERPPTQIDWFYTRMASMLRKIYIEGPVGTQSLRTYYGGRKNRGSEPSHSYKGSGKIIRTCLQELEKLELIKKQKTGRIITAKGEKYLSEKSKHVLQQMKKGIDHGTGLGASERTEA